MPAAESVAAFIARRIFLPVFVGVDFFPGPAYV
jgi:hypothetical protein